MKDLKYLIAYIVPMAALTGLYLRGNWAFFTPILAFVLVPIFEIILPVNPNNLSDSETLSKSKNRFFNWLLYANVPLVFTIVIWFLYSLNTQEYSTSELVGLIFSVGIVVGSNGINVAHELGHRQLQWEKTLGKLLLLPALYMHFFIEHNYGHHQHAATPEDPATAKYNQTLYAFWFSSIIRQYTNSWTIQKQLLSRENAGFFSFKNDMFWYTFFQLGYALLVFMFFGSIGLLVAISIGAVAILLLETINYVEHYGLRRMKTTSGRYERVTEIHSWNSNHVMGRMMLYELTRHSDHHYKSHKKFQVLEYHDVSPQMPYGYPTSMVLAMIPPLWFSIMNKRIPLEMRT